MSHADETPSPSRPKGKPQARRPLLSHSSVLILSIFLIGMASGHWLAAELRRYALLGGLAGMAAYMAFEQLNRVRQDRAESRAARKLENRFNRHVQRRVEPSRKNKSSKPDSDEQYLPVAKSWGAGRV